MNPVTRRPGALILLAMLAAVAPAGLAAQQSDGEVLTTVYGTTPSDLSGMPAGPEVEGYISARSGDKLQVTSAGGTKTVVFLSSATEIKASGGFLGMGSSKLDQSSLLNGLPVAVETVRWEDGLLAKRVSLKAKDLKTATMIHTGTDQRFGANEEAIKKNAAATEALRGRLGDIDKYNVVGVTNVFFATGKWKISPSDQNLLCSAAREAEPIDGALLLVVGYTDSVGSQEANQVLSEKRASGVVNYLQQACGWKPWRMLSPTGMASADPLADNSTAAGKAQNRRVSVNVLVSKAMDGM